MKFDSYTRFLKSPLYQECILAEVEGRPLPDPQRVPSSPTSKHSVSSDKSNMSTPKKVTSALLLSQKCVFKECFPSSLEKSKRTYKIKLKCVVRGAGKYNCKILCTQEYTYFFILAFESVS